MKTWVVLACVGVGVAVFGCSGPMNPENKALWKVVQSPISGKCYEVYGDGVFNQRVLAMGSEVSCDLFNKKAR